VRSAAAVTVQRYHLREVEEAVKCDDVARCCCKLIKTRDVCALGLSFDDGFKCGTVLKVVAEYCQMPRQSSEMVTSQANGVFKKH